MGNRRKARELAIQILFHMEFSNGTPEENVQLICENFETTTAMKAFSEELVLGISQNRDSIDKVIVESSENWRLERMSRVDKSILRLGVYELIYLEDIPPKVSIDEAVELGKKFGTEDSGAFINGILDNILTKLSRDVSPSLKKQ